MEVTTLLNVCEILKVKDLGFPILLNESEDHDIIVLECGAARGVQWAVHYVRVTRRRVKCIF